MVAAALQLHRQRDSVIDAGHPYDREHRHHQFRHGKWMAGRGFHEQQARLRRHVQADGGGNLARVTSHPVTADRTFTALIDILQQHRLKLLGLGRAELHRLLAFHQAHQLVGDAIDHNQHLFVGADDVVIKRGAFDDGPRGARQVGRFVDHYRRVTGAGGNQTFIGMLARGLHHRFTAGDHQQANTGVLKQPLGRFDVRVRHGDQQIGRTARGNHRLVEQHNRPLRDLFRRRMRGEHHAIARGNQADGVINYRRRRVGGGGDRGHHAPGRVFNQRQAVIAGEHLRREALHARRAARLGHVFGKFIFNATHAGFADGKLR